MNHFKIIRDRLIEDLIYFRESYIEDNLEVDILKDTLLHIIDVYRVKYGGIDYLNDELLFLVSFILDTLDDIELDLSYEVVYEAITRTLILMETIDDRAKMN